MEDKYEIRHVGLKTSPDSVQIDDLIMFSLSVDDLSSSWTSWKWCRKPEEHVYRAGQRSSGGQIKAWTSLCKSCNHRTMAMLSCGQSTGPPGQVLVSFHRNITWTHCPALDCFSVSRTSVTLSLTRSSELILQTSLSSVSEFTVRNTCSALWP